MNIQKKQCTYRTKQGFTLIEMIGVLAVIAILAALLVPRVFEAINSARVNNAAVSINTVKTACVDHYAKFNTLLANGSTGTAAPLQLGTDAILNTYDQVLIGEQFLDKPFVVKIGDGTYDATHTRIQVVAAAGPGVAADGTNPAYNLDGANLAGAAVNDAAGTYVAEAVITGVDLADARALNRAIDGSTAALGEAAGGGADLAGRVHYAAPAAGQPVEVHVYLTHR